MSKKLELKLSWRVKPECGWSCEYLFAGIKLVGWYSTSMIKGKSGVEFYGRLAMDSQAQTRGTREEVKVWLIDRAMNWIHGALAGSTIPFTAGGGAP